MYRPGKPAARRNQSRPCPFLGAPKCREEAREDRWRVLLLSTRLHLDSRLRGNDKTGASRMLPGVWGCPPILSFLSPKTGGQRGLKAILDTTSDARPIMAMSHLTWRPAMPLTAGHSPECAAGSHHGRARVLPEPASARHSVRPAGMCPSCTAPSAQSRPAPQRCHGFPR